MGIFDIFKNKNDDVIEEIQNCNIESSAQASSENNELEIMGRVIEEIKKETSALTIELTLTDAKPSIFESKIGGLGYIPHDGNFPTDSKGNQLRLLAQLDCEKIAHPDYPKNGLLQFWILNDDLYGADFNNMTVQDGFRIIYHAEVDRSITEEEVEAKIVRNEFEAEESYLPVDGEYALEFSECNTFMTECDYHFESIFAQKYNELNPEKQINSIYDTEHDFDEVCDYEKMTEQAFGHKIGGYPAFTQTDPRDNGDTHDFLLLQLDSEFGGGKDRIIWGDAGVCNFFINRDKLRSLDFSDVIYNWDCY